MFEGINLLQNYKDTDFCMQCDVKNSTCVLFNFMMPNFIAIIKFVIALH